MSSSKSKGEQEDGEENENKSDGIIDEVGVVVEVQSENEKANEETSKQVLAGAGMS